MGDRANIKITHGDSVVFLYTHWHGTELPKIVRKGLRLPQARARWGDGYYLGRILFEHLISYGSSKETGFGISSVVSDGANRVIHVNVDEQTVTPWGLQAQTFKRYIGE